MVKTQAEIDKYDYDNMLTDYTNALRLRSDKSMLDVLSEMRKIPREYIEEAGIFYIEDMAEMIHPAFLNHIPKLGVISETNKKPIFRKRYVFPINNSEGLVQNLVGYSRDADERYVYGTSKYYRRTDTLWGLENLYDAYDKGYAFVTEGITDSLRMRSLGYDNTFAMCGTHSSDFIMRQLNRCKYGVILIPDRDSAGIRAHKNWNFLRSVTLYISIFFKDLDEMCASGEENTSIFTEYADAAIRWITSGEHYGREGAKEKLVIV